MNDVVVFTQGEFYLTQGGWPAEIISIDQTILARHYLQHGMLITTHHNLDGIPCADPDIEARILTPTKTIKPYDPDVVRY